MSNEEKPKHIAIPEMEEPDEDPGNSQAEIDAHQCGSSRASATPGASRVHWKTRQKYEKILEDQIARRTLVRNSLEDRVDRIKLLCENPPENIRRHAKLHATMLERSESELRTLDTEIADLMRKLNPSDLVEDYDRVIFFEEMVIGAQSDLEDLQKASLADRSEHSVGGASADDQCIQPDADDQRASTPQMDPGDQRGPETNVSSLPMIVKVVQEKSRLFESYVNSKDIPVIQKFAKLKESLIGPARQEIAHISFCVSQYEIALKRIHDVYGDEQDAEQQHVKEISGLFNAKDLHRPDKLRHFHSTLSQNVLALVALGKRIDGLSTFLVHNLIRVLPRSLQLQFLDIYEDLRKSGDSRCELEVLIDFLERQVKIHRKIADSSTRYRSPTPYSSNDSQSNYKPARFEHQSANFSSTVINTSRTVPAGRHMYSCVFCEASHLSRNCKAPLTLEERKEKVSSKRACFRCLRLNHSAVNCKANVRCSICSHKHYPLMCPKQDKVSPSVSQCDVTTTILSSVDALEGSTLLPTGFVWAHFGNRKKKVRILLDTCSHRSYVSKRTISDLAAKPTDSTLLSLGSIGGNVSDVQRFQIYELSLQSCFSPQVVIPVRCLEIAEISKSVLPLVKQTYGLTPSADLGGDGEDLSIEILLGADILPKIEKEQKRLLDGLSAFNTQFGWFFYGGVVKESDTRPPSLCAFSLIQPWRPEESRVSPVEEEPLTKDIDFLWNSETLGIESPNENQNEIDELDEELIKHHRRTTRKLADGRFSVSLPFRNNLETLGDNESLTRSRLIRLLNSLANDQDTIGTIDKEISEYISNGYAEPAPPRIDGEPAHYLPIQAIVKSSPEYPTGKKSRIVKDASARSADRASLNDVLHQGPSLLPDILKVLIHVRRFKYAVAADVEKAFLQIKVNPDHRTFLRFLWPLGISTNPRARWQEFWNTSLDFGLVCSPFLFCQTIKLLLESQAAEDTQKSALANEVIDSYYMDDVFSGGDSLNEASHKIKLLFEMFYAGKFRLRKWSTNSSALADIIPLTVPFPDVNVTCEKTDAKLLGVKWNQREDSLGVFTKKALVEMKSDRASKRILLKALAQLFDPLGIMSPSTVSAKILLQKLWKKARDWDEDLEGDDLDDFVRFRECIERSSSLSVPRPLKTDDRNLAVRELHTFSDASLSAYGCVCYVRDIFSSGPAKVSFLMSKARVSPLKSKQTIHRLELQGAVVAARIALRVGNYLIPQPERKLYYTDNAACLGWLRDSNAKWKTFVANRTREILSSSRPSDWSYVKSSDNPADILSRAMDINEEATKLMWLKGPPWLEPFGKDPSLHPLNTPRATTETDAERIEEICMMTVSAPQEHLFDELSLISRTNSWPKIVRIWAFTRRVAQKFCQTRVRLDQQGSLGQTAMNSGRDPPINLLTISTEEFVLSRDDLIRRIQQRRFPIEYSSECQSVPKTSSLFKYSPFFSEDRFIRSRTRLERAESFTYDEIYPILLPSDEPAVKLLILNIHARECLHSGGIVGTLHNLRRRYLVLKARRLTKTS
ncbi:uncharacterized protein LOC100904258 [Galendromus occidentalis]|uniref:Uncharacterized protein LOC100904258 n=1 Tax=Galendromus occidentalis TaxID=34638 RepID=A0AAJ6VVU1_9ACAR|nr:uncharacterized protein LOC100904258 [Galendromus occidentalis]